MADFMGNPQNTLITISLNYKYKDAEGKIATGTETITLGQVQQFAYQVRRAKAPIYVIGSVSPITIAKGARSVAGTMAGVILSESFQMNLIKYFWAKTADTSKVDISDLNGIQRISAEKEIEDIYGTKQNFYDKFVKPLLESLGVSANNQKTKDGNNPYDIDNKYKWFPTDSIPLDYAMKIPPMYLDEVPPVNLKMITPIKQESGVITYEEVEFVGLEFLNNDLAVQAGREAIFESTNFIQRSVSKTIKTKSFS